MDLSLDELSIALSYAVAFSSGAAPVPAAKAAPAAKKAAPAKAAADERAASSWRPLVNEWTEHADHDGDRVVTNDHDMDDAATIYELPVRSLAEVLGLA
jgi:hypothetical protein